MGSFYYAETTVSITAHYTDEKCFVRQSTGIVKKLQKSNWECPVSVMVTQVIINNSYRLAIYLMYYRLSSISLIYLVPSLSRV